MLMEATMSQKQIKRLRREMRKQGYDLSDKDTCKYVQTSDGVLNPMVQKTDDKGHGFNMQMTYQPETLPSYKISNEISSRDNRVYKRVKKNLKGYVKEANKNKH